MSGVTFSFGSAAWDVTESSIKLFNESLKGAKETKVQGGLEFPLVLEYMKTAFATLSLENPTFIADQFFEADSSNQAPYFLGVLIQAALRVKLDEKLFKRVMHKQPNGVLAWYAFAKKYKLIDYESQVQVLHNFGYALTKGNSELMERATTAFAYYFDVPKKLIPLAACAIMDDGTRQKFFDKTGYNDPEAGFENLSFDEVAGFFEEMSQKYSRIEEENLMELAQNVVHQRGSSGRKNWTCWNCGKKGHIARDCPNHKPGLSKFYERKPDARAFYLQTVFDAEENHSSEEAWLVETKPGPGTGISSVKPNYGRKKAFSTVGACKTDAAVRFTLDSGSTCHLANMKIKLANVRRDDTKVLGVNGLSTVKQQGDLLSQKLSVNGIKLMDGLPRNLLSIPKIVDSGFDVLLSKHNGSIANRKNGNVVLNFPRVGPFWELSVKADSAEEMAFNVESYEGLKAIKEVHESNNHAKLRTMKELLKGHGVLEADIKYVLTSCETCMSKVTKPGGKPAVRKYNVGEMIQADVIGPINKAYALIVSDRASKFVAHRVLKSRAEVSAKTIECLGMFHNFLKQADSNKNIVMFRADNEFDTNAIKNWLDGSPSSGRNFIDFEPTAPHSSHQNGGAERLNGILQEKMFSILKASGVDISYWNFALSHAVFVHNYLPLNGGRSPYELLREQKKEFQVKAPFGCRVFIKDYHRQSKFDPIQEEAGVFLGYSKTTKIVFALLKDGRVVRSSAFRFMPLVYPLKNGQAALGGAGSGSGGGMFVGGGGGRVGGVSGASGGVHVPDRDMSVDSIAAFDENLENVTQDSSFSGGDESSVEEEDQAEPFDVDMSDATASKSDGQATPEQVGAKQASPDPVFPDPMPRSESSGDDDNGLSSGNDAGISSSSNYPSNYYGSEASDTDDSQAKRFSTFGHKMFNNAQDSEIERLFPSATTAMSITEVLVRPNNVTQVIVKPVPSDLQVKSTRVPDEKTRGTKRVAHSESESDTTTGMLLESKPVKKMIAGPEGRLVVKKHQAVKDLVPYGGAGKGVQRVADYTVPRDNQTNKWMENDPTIVYQKNPSVMFNGRMLVGPEPRPLITDGKDVASTSEEVEQPLLLTTKDGEISLLAEEVYLAVERTKYEIPNNYSQVLASEQKVKWLIAILNELTALKINKVYEEVDYIEGMKTVNSRWVFSVKAKASEEVFKARLVCKGFSQERGVNYLDYWAPVASFDTVRFVLSIAAAKNWSMVQLDATTAFLNGDIDYSIYVKPPAGTETPAGKVWKLRKSLYGLKQSPAIWYDKLAGVLKSADLKVSNIDPCLFYDKGIMVLVYVDDMLVFGENEKKVKEIKEVLCSKFKMKELDGKMFLGVTIQRDDATGTMKISMKDFIEKVEKELNIQKLTPMRAPMVKGYNPHDVASPFLDEEEQSKYRSLIGTLLYIVNTVRVDICFPVNMLSQFMSAPRKTHLHAAQKVFQYLMFTKDQGVVYGPNAPLNIEYQDFRLIDRTKENKPVITQDYPKETGYRITAISDSDYATDKEDRKSQGGHCVFINNQLVSWSSRKQKSVALSTAEAEYVALSEAARSSIYFRNLLNEVGLNCAYVNLVGDNSSSLTLSAHKAIHQKTKHIDIRAHFIRSLVHDKVIKLNWISTKQNIADFLTKAVDTTTFKALSSYVLY